MSESLDMPIERSFYVGGMKFAAQEWGRVGALPILALHGWLDNSASFNALSEHLGDVHLIALDLAGHGRSDHRPGAGPYNIWEDVGELFAIADQLGWSQFALLGHSRGGIIGMLAAGTFPERITHLGLIEALWPEENRTHDAPRQLARSILETRVLASKKMTVYPDLERATRARERGMFPLSQRAARALTERGTVAGEDGYCWSTDQRLLAPSALKMTEEHLEAFLKRSEARYCMVLGKEGVPRLFSHYREALALFPERMSLEMLSGGHHLHMEQQAPAVAAKLAEFYSSK